MKGYINGVMANALKEKSKYWCGLAVICDFQIDVNGVLDQAMLQRFVLCQSSDVAKRERDGME